MALIRLFNGKDVERLISKKVITPETHIVVVRFSTFYFVPIVTSRHRHYIIAKMKREESREFFKTLAKQGFTIMKGSLRFIEAR